jgi:hypothetical protein
MCLRTQQQQQPCLLIDYLPCILLAAFKQLATQTTHAITISESQAARCSISANFVTCAAMLGVRPACSDEGMTSQYYLAAAGVESKVTSSAAM